MEPSKVSNINGDKGSTPDRGRSARGSRALIGCLVMVALLILLVGGGV
jgi:hypothetical protein